MKKAEGGAAFLSAQVPAEVRGRVEAVKKALGPIFDVSLSEVQEAILTAFFVANKQPEDAKKIEDLVRRIRSGELKLKEQKE